MTMPNKLDPLHFLLSLIIVLVLIYKADFEWAEIKPTKQSELKMEQRAKNSLNKACSKVLARN